MSKLPDIHASNGPEQLLSDIRAYIDAAEMLVKEKDIMPLAGLDSVVEELCKRILSLEEDKAKNFKPALEELVGRLDNLQQGMSTLKGEVADAIKSIDTKKKARKAYASANYTKPSEE